MTREIALHCMKSYSELHSDLCELCPIYGQTGSDHCFEDALEYAIKAIEQEPTTRNCFGCKYAKDNHNSGTEECHLCMWENQYTPIKCIKSMPSVTPQEPTNNYLADGCIDKWDIDGEKAEAWIVKGKMQIRYHGSIHNFALPSVTLQELKTGHWIIDTHKIRAFGKKYETHDYSVYCDKCNYAWDYTTDKEGSLASNFCPNCGAKMESESRLK